MKTKVRSVFAFTLALMLLVFAAAPASALNKNTSNRFNVCFVMDSTLSLSKTDPESLRFDATNMFLGLLANDGNYVGSVLFSGDNIKANEIVPIKGPQDKANAEKALEAEITKGKTTFGPALDKALDMLTTKGDKSLPSVIVLLSDGMSEDATDEEKESRANALVKAKKNGVPVYSVSLNADGEADSGVLEYASKATGGEFEEVSSAGDLKEVFKNFYKMIYSAGAQQIIDGTIPSDGMINVNFSVPSHGVEEVNIIISSDAKIEGLTLTSGAGRVYSEDEVKAITTEAKKYTITKITKPDGGEWTLSGRGEPGSEIKIDMVFNDTITIETEYEKKDVYSLNETVPVSGYVLEAGQRIASRYDEYTAKLVPDGNKGEPFDMKPDGDRLVANVTFTEEGTHTYHMELEDGDGMKKSTEPGSIKLDVGDLPPKLTDKAQDFGQHFWVFPFFTKTCEISLDGVAVDPEGKELTYEVIDSTFKDTTYEISGDKLVIKDFYDLPKGISTIRASDPKGSYVEFEATASLTNVGIIALIAIGGGALIFAGLAAFVIYRLSQKKFMGTITVRNLETGATATQQKNRGNIKLSAFQIGNPGFASDARFQATGKSYIYFMSKKPVVSDSFVGKQKKAVLQNRNETRLYSDDSRTRGISVTFDSYLQ